jgi:hypothetical protein
VSERKFIENINNFNRCTPVRGFASDLNIPYIYDYKTKLRRKEAEVIQNHLNPNVLATGQEEAMSRKYKSLKLDGGQAYGLLGD